MKNEKKKDEKRSKSADNKWRVVNSGFQRVSRSLPSLAKNAVDKEKDKELNGEAGAPVETKEERKRRRKQEKEEAEAAEKQRKEEALREKKEAEKKAKIMIANRDERKKTMWRHIAWLFILFAYSFLGGILFSAIEGGYETNQLIKQFEKESDTFENRHIYQEQLFKRLRDIDRDKTIPRNQTMNSKQYKLQQSRAALEWYERKLSVKVEEPKMVDTKWNLWGGVYYAASLYTTIGYGDFHPETRSGRIVSMLYASVGIPLVFTILLDWGFLYFTWIEYAWNRLNENFCQKSLQRDMERKVRREKIRRVGSEMSLSSTTPLLHRTTTQLSNNPVQHIESVNPLAPLDVELPVGEQVQTVPIKAALIFFVLWIQLSAFVVRIWEYEWTYFNAFYYFFTSLTTIGLGDVVTKPKFIFFNLALTLVGLSVVGLCIAIVQAKVKLVFDRMLRCIDAQYRIRQIDPQVATMTLIDDEDEGIKRLIQSQSLEDRIVFLFVDEHKKTMLKERWKQKSAMINRLTQTYPSRADKYVQTGQRVYTQPTSDDEGSDAEDEDEEAAEYDEEGNKIIVPPIRRYIYTVFD